MNNRRLVRDFMLCLALAASAISCGSAGHPPLILVDRWWNEDFAKGACHSTTISERDSRCEEKAVSDLRLYVAEVVNRFQSESSCEGVTFTTAMSTDPGPDPAAVWQLMIDFNINESSTSSAQSWTLVNRKNNSEIINGLDTADQTVRRMCAVVKRRGGRIS